MNPRAADDPASDIHHHGRYSWALNARVIETLSHREALRARTCYLATRSPTLPHYCQPSEPQAHRDSVSFPTRMMRVASLRTLRCWPRRPKFSVLGPTGRADRPRLGANNLANPWWRIVVQERKAGKQKESRSDSGRRTHRVLIYSLPSHSRPPGNKDFVDINRHSSCYVHPCVGDNWNSS